MKSWILFLNIIASQLAAQTTVYTLCEGNFGSSNASLWSFDETGGNITGPVHWDPNSNPLGDVGQSLKIHDNKLFIVMNNSHSVEIMDLLQGAVYETTINVPGAGPRYLEIVNDTAYLTCWNLNGILVIDLNNYSITDTINVNGMPEDIIHHNGQLYVSLNLNSDWTSGNQVLAIDITGDPAITDSFEVIPGPGGMLLSGNYLYIASTYYDDAWQTYAGTSRIDLETKTVITREHGLSYTFGNDLVDFLGQVYSTYHGGIAPLTDSLTIDAENQIGNFPGLYSVATSENYIYFGLTDYSAPDEVTIMNASGQIITTLQVGAIPGSFAVYSAIANSVEPVNSLPQQTSVMWNYPNPFNARTTLAFELDQSGDVTLEIVNLLGEKVTTLIDESMYYGTYFVDWQAGSIPSGVYFGLLQINGKMISHKIIYLK